MWQNWELTYKCKRSNPDLPFAAFREFEMEYRKLLEVQLKPKIAENFKCILRKWAENESKSKLYVGH